MATQLQIRRGTATQVAAFTGAEGEIVVNTTNDSVHVNDGSTQGGFELARVDGANWNVTNNISTTGSVTAASLVVDTTTLVVDATNNRVGAGVASPKSNMHVLGTLKVATGNAQGILGLGEGAGTTVNVGLWRGAANNPTSDGNFLNLGGFDGIVFAASNAAIGSQSERARIDGSGRLLVGLTGASGFGRVETDTLTTSGQTILARASGALLVGKTADDNTTQGIRLLGSSGFASFVRASAEPIVVNRLTDDGDLIEFRADGTTVGTIGNRFNALYIHSPDGTNGSGLRFFDGVIQPCESNGNDSDGDTDLGQVSSRFKDLYLSGGVYLGGTGSANELSEYEEGAWTPTFQSFNGTFSQQSASYRKIGQTCFAWFHLDISSSHTGTNANLVVTGLPFSTQIYASVYGMTTTMHCNLWATANKADNGIMGPGSSIISFYRNEGQTGIYTPSLSDIGTGNFLCCLVFPTA